MASSYLFPKIFGKKVAQELVIEGRTVNSEFLEKYNLLESHANIDAAKKALQEHLANLDELEWESYLVARKLFNDPDRDMIKKVNHIECQNLI